MLSEAQHVRRRQIQAFESFQVPDHLEKCELIYFNERNNSTVIQARDVATSELFAVKRIPCVCTQQVGFCRNVVREIVIHLWLTHEGGENIVPLLDVYLERTKKNEDEVQQQPLPESEEKSEAQQRQSHGQQHPQQPPQSRPAPPRVHRARDIYLVMPFIEHDLCHVLMKRALVETEIKWFALQLFQAVKNLHDRRLLHRDLSLSNILISADAQLFLSDFGLSRCKDAKTQGYCGEDDVEPGTCTVVTIEYRAPELLLRYNKYDNRIDVWSLGCILTECFLRVPVFSTKQRDEQSALRALIAIGGEPPLDVIDELGRGCSAPRAARDTIERVRAAGGLRPPLAFIRERLKHAKASPEAIEFVCNCLNFDFRKRWDVNTALQHKWLADCFEDAEEEEEGENDGTEKRVHAEKDSVVEHNNNSGEEVVEDESDDDSSNHAGSAIAVEDEASQMLVRRCGDEDASGSASSSSMNEVEQQQQQHQQQQPEVPWLSLPMPYRDDAKESGNVDLISVQTKTLPELVDFLENLCERASAFFENSRKQKLLEKKQKEQEAAAAAAAAAQAAKPESVDKAPAQ